MNLGKLLVRLILQTSVWLAIMGLLLFLPARNWGWTEAWVFLAIFALGSDILCGWLLRYDPALLKSRLGSLVQKDQPWWDRLFMALAVVGWCAWLVLMALDAQRWHVSSVPGWLKAAGGLLIVTGFAAIVPVFRANSFAAPVVRVQSERNQRVIETGPYGIVRHPMYSAATLYLFGIPLLLGSWYGLIGSGLIVAAIAWRATMEEQTLKNGLAGYADYMTRVRYRLMPYVW
jgi:protein-S-isoprenylcysteine O-methyltransferase Ste14